MNPAMLNLNEKRKLKLEKIEENKNQKPSSKHPDCWPMVRVTWEDAMDGESGWVELDKILNAKLATCVDIGWLVKRDDNKTVLMGSWCVDPNDTEGGRYIAIPTGWIKKMEYLSIDHATVRD